MTISLTPEINALIEAEVASGRFSTPAEVVAAGIRLLREEEAHERPTLEAFRTELIRRLEEADRGEVMNGDEVFAELEEDARRRSMLPA